MWGKSGGGGQLQPPMQFALADAADHVHATGGRKSDMDATRAAATAKQRRFVFVSRIMLFVTRACSDETGQFGAAYRRGKLAMAGQIFDL